VPETIEAATDDEIFDFIDKELGHLLTAQQRGLPRMTTNEEKLVVLPQVGDDRPAADAPQTAGEGKRTSDRDRGSGCRTPSGIAVTPRPPAVLRRVCCRSVVTTEVIDELLFVGRFFCEVNPSLLRGQEMPSSLSMKSKISSSVAA